MNWQTIKSLRGSQNNAFEELVCQVAREEPLDGQIIFTRVAAPDAGVEAYCVFDNGDEFGWQAKFFLSLGDSQWAQLDRSFHTAFEKHPRLIKYYICVPIDRNDARVGRQKSAMEKWNDKVQEWKQLAATKGRSIEFEYWGSSELIHRLSKEIHAGRIRCWFGDEEFSDTWFKRIAERNIKDIGQRYTPHLNIETKLKQAFSYISHNAAYRKAVESRFDEVLLLINRVIEKTSSLPQDQAKEILTQAKYDIEAEHKKSQDCYQLLFDIHKLKDILKNIEVALNSFDDYLEQLRKNKQGEQYAQSTINRLRNGISEFDDYLDSPEIALANNPVCILSGVAGSGKSHLLADITHEKIEAGIPTLLLLGFHFRSTAAPWTQIFCDMLQISSCSVHEFLGALNTLGEARRERVLIMLDGINEGEGKSVWPNSLNGFIADVKRYPWIGLVISIRTSYENAVLPPEVFCDGTAIKLIHHGFESIESQAARQFFAYYNIDYPQVPLLHPEFSNPLFLKILCEGFRRLGITSMPKGFEGISQLFELYLDSIEKKLSVLFSFSESLHLVRKCVDAFIDFKKTNEVRYVTYEQAIEAICTATKTYVLSHTFLDSLIAEGLFTKRIYHVNRKDFEEVSLTFERFDDYYTARRFIDQNEEAIKDRTAFASKDKVKSYLNYSGILEAFSVLFPEKYSIEFAEGLQDEDKNYIVAEALTNSLVWRKYETITDATNKLINNLVLKWSGTFDLFFRTLYLVAPDPEHPYNADMLHKYLSEYSMAKRDAFWIPFLHSQSYDNTNEVNRIISWALSEDKHDLSNKSCLLAAKALSWVLPSTNIDFRDKATYALKELLTDKLIVAKELLIDFAGVNDPYVIERILAAIYGAALCSVNLLGLNELSQKIVEILFDTDGEVYPNILVRDYARNIVEYAIHSGEFVLDDPKIIRPPYKSAIPKTFPTNEAIDKYEFDYKAPDFQDHYWSQNQILSSMVTEYGRGIGAYGDFGRYTFEYAFTDWGQLDANRLSNYACKLIFKKYGYDVNLHGKFDRHATTGDRFNNKTERIGKKYQWLALYEILARVSDNYEKQSRYDEKTLPYQGPWDPLVRNIDPTVYYHANQESALTINTNAWTSYEDWSGEETSWLTNDTDIPDPKALINVVDNAGVEWVILEAYFSWDQPMPIGRKKGEYPYRRLWYQIRSYFTKPSQHNFLTTWLSDKNFMGRWMPEGNTYHQIFDREYYWSPAYTYFRDLDDSDTWDDIREKKRQGKSVGKVIPAAENYSWENGGSTLNSNSHLVPHQVVFEGIHLLPTRNLGEWMDEDGRICCAVLEDGSRGHSALILRRDKLNLLLKSKKLSIFWTCLGEKQIVGTVRGNKPRLPWLELSGVYQFKRELLKGNLNKFSNSPIL